MEKYAIIYMFTNRINGKKYIGQTWNELRRSCEHKVAYGECRAFHNAIKKYGIDSFDYEVLQSNIFDQESLDNAERAWIKKMDTLSPHGYNLRDGGMGGRCSEDAKERMSIIQKKIAQDPIRRQKLQETARNTSLNPVWKQHIKEAAQKRKNDPEWRKAISDGIKKRSLNIDWRKNHADAIRLAVKKEEWGKNHKQAMQKLAKDPNWIKNNQENLRKIHESPECRKKIINSLSKKHKTDKEFYDRTCSIVRKTVSTPEWREKQQAGVDRRGLNAKWLENNRKAAQLRASDPEWIYKNKKAQEKRAKPVICIENGIIYRGSSYAEKELGISHSKVGEVCNGRRKIAGGYHWRYATQEEAITLRPQMEVISV